MGLATHILTAPKTASQDCVSGLVHSTFLTENYTSQSVCVYLRMLCIMVSMYRPYAALLAKTYRWLLCT